MIRISSTSHYFRPLRDGEPLPGLQADLKDVTREPYRRVDRFIQLALLGAGRCVRGRTLAQDCGLYLGSGLGPMGENVAVQEHLVRGRETPMPFNFINVLGSSAGYYVAKDLGLAGQNFFVSRRGASFEAVLATAVGDLSLGVVKQALVGVVEDLSLPLAHHRARQSLPPDAALAEGSHWLLLETEAPRGRTLTLRHHADEAALREAMAALEGAEQRGLATGPFHDSLAGAWVTERLAAGAKQGLLLPEGTGFGLFHFGP